MDEATAKEILEEFVAADLGDVSQHAIFTAKERDILAAIDAAGEHSELRKQVVDGIDKLGAFFSNSEADSASQFITSLNKLRWQCCSADEMELAAQLDIRIGIIAHERGLDPLAQKALQRAVMYYEAKGDNLGLGHCYFRLGQIEEHGSRLKEASIYYNCARESYQAVGNERGVADATYGLGQVDRLNGKAEDAIAKFEHAGSTFKKVGFTKGQANCLFSIGEIGLDTGQLDRAKESLENAETLYQGIGYKLGIAHCMKGRAELESRSGALTEVQIADLHTRYQAARAMYESIGELAEASRCLLGEGMLEKDRDPQKATKYYQQGLKLLGMLKQRKESPGAPHYEAQFYEQLSEVAATDVEKDLYLKKATLAWTKAQNPDETQCVKAMLDLEKRGRF